MPVEVKIAETEDVADNDSNDDSPATHEIPDYDWASFFTDDENDSEFKRFYIRPKILFKLASYTHMPEERTKGSKIDLNLSAGSTNMRVFTVTCKDITKHKHLMDNKAIISPEIIKKKTLCQLMTVDHSCLFWYDKVYTYK